MNIYIHTIVATLPICFAYLVGRYWGREALVENIVNNLISKLDKDGFITTATDKDGDIELVPISEVVAKSLREAKNYV